MYTTLLLSLSLLSGVAGNLFSKWKSNRLRSNTPLRYVLYLFLNGVVGALFFFLSGGGAMKTDAMCLLFSALCGFCVAGVLVCGVMLLHLASVVGVHVLQSACSMVASGLLGAMLFHEVVDGWRILRMVLMVLAALLVVLEGGGVSVKRSEKGSRKGGALLLVLLLILSTCSSVGYSLSMQYYLRTVEGADPDSLFCFTNVFLAVGTILLFAVLSPVRRAEARDSMAMFRPRMLFLIAASTLLSNVSSLLQAYLVEVMDAAVLSPVTSAISVLCAFVASLILKERIGKYSYGAALLSLLTVLLPG